MLVLVFSLFLSVYAVALIVNRARKYEDESYLRARVQGVREESVEDRSRSRGPCSTCSWSQHHGRASSQRVLQQSSSRANLPGGFGGHKPILDVWIVCLPQGQTFTVDNFNFDFSGVTDSLFPAGSACPAAASSTA